MHPNSDKESLFVKDQKEKIHVGTLWPAGSYFEIKERGRWLEVSEWIFRSWGGERQINGVIYDGPVYYLGSDEIAIPANKNEFR